MRLTRRQLKRLVENYLTEQEEGAPPVDEPEEAAEEEPADDGAPPVDDSGEPPADEEAEPEAEAEPEPEPGENIPDKTSPFEIIIDDVKHTVQFIKDKAANVLKLKIDGVEVKNPKPQDFVTMAGLGMQGKLSDEDSSALETIVKKTDNSFAKFENFDDVAKVIQDKMNAERKGFSVADIREIIGKIKK